MGEEQLIENIQIVTDKLSNLFGFAMTKQGKSADKDKLFLQVCFMSLFCGDINGRSWVYKFYMAYLEEFTNRPGVFMDITDDRKLC